MKKQFKEQELMESTIDGQCAVGICKMYEGTNTERFEK